MKKGPLQGKRVLVAPLDWGLGHATRSMPVIDHLVDNGAEVILAGEGRSFQLLKNAYPSFSAIQLPEYRISYSRSSFTVTKTLFQTPRLLAVFRHEHQVLDKLISEHRIDAVISDNRYGLWSKRIPSVFICHQLAIVMPRGLGLFRRAVYKAHLKYISRFKYLWIPDFAATSNLSGSLSHQYLLPANARFIGPQSRFRAAGDSTPTRGHILVLLSGPEPQRTLLEEKLLMQIKDLNYHFTIVRGITEQSAVIPGANFTMHNFMDAERLHHRIAESEVVISRPGYSTIMDLSVFGKKALFIPTPGQTEQEYLANMLSKKGYVVAQRQHRVEVKEGIELALKLQGLPAIAVDTGFLGEAMDELGRDVNR